MKKLYWLPFSLLFFFNLTQLRAQTHGWRYYRMIQDTIELEKLVKTIVSFDVVAGKAERKMLMTNLEKRFPSLAEKLNIYRIDDPFFNTAALMRLSFAKEMDRELIVGEVLRERHTKLSAQYVNTFKENGFTESQAIMLAMKEGIIPLCQRGPVKHPGRYTLEEIDCIVDLYERLLEELKHSPEEIRSLSEMHRRVIMKFVIGGKSPAKK